MSKPLAWDEIAGPLARALGERVTGGAPMTAGWSSRTTWAGHGELSGPLVVKARHGDDAYQKTAWCAARLPLLGGRGYPVPTIIWHGPARDQWHLTVQNRLPGRRLTALDGPLIDEVLTLVERQADAGIPADDRDFTGYIANVLFDDWDEVWADAGRAGGAGPLCARIRRWLEPVWGLRLPPADFAHNDLNLSNILTDGERITGVVDWDEFGLGSRALDLVVLALDCEELGDRAAADRLLAAGASAVGQAGLRCLVSYRALASLAEDTREGVQPPTDIQAISAILDRLPSGLPGGGAPRFLLLSTREGIGQKIMDDLHAYTVLFLRQDKSFQDLLLAERNGVLGGVRGSFRGRWGLEVGRVGGRAWSLRWRDPGVGGAWGPGEATRGPVGRGAAGQVAWGGLKQAKGDAMSQALAGTAALVTGANSGIGAATARRLAAEGAAVGLVARRLDRLTELAGDIKQEAGARTSSRPT